MVFEYLIMLRTGQIISSSNIFNKISSNQIVVLIWQDRRMSDASVNLQKK
jgi:hypothetical protein